MTPRIFKVSAWLLVAALVLVNVVPASERPVTGINHDLEHFIAFAVLAAAFSLAYSHLGMRILLSVGGFFTLAVELAQIPLPTRHARFEDFFWDTAAVWFAVILVTTLRSVVNLRDWRHSMFGFQRERRI